MTIVVVKENSIPLGKTIYNKFLSYDNMKGLITIVRSLIFDLCLEDELNS